MQDIPISRGQVIHLISPIALVARNLSELQRHLLTLEQRGGGMIQLTPNTTYTLTNTLEVPDNVIIRGAGRTSLITIINNAPLTLKQYRWSDGSYINIYPIICNKNEDAAGIILENFRIEGNGDNQVTTRHTAGIFFGKAKNCKSVNMIVNDVLWDSAWAGGSRAYCLLTTEAENISIIGGIYSRAGYECIGIRSESKHITLNDVTIYEGKQHCFQGVSATDIKMDNCVIDARGVAGVGGITFHHGARTSISNCNIKSTRACIKPFDGYRGLAVTNCIMEASSGEVINVHQNKDGIQSGDICISNSLMVALGGGTSDEVVALGKYEGDPVDNILIDNCTMHNKGTAVGNNVVRIMNGTTRVAVRGCIIKGDAGRGVLCENSSRVKIINNEMDVKTYGIRFDNSSDNMAIGNDIKCNSRGIGATGTGDYNIISNNNLRTISNASYRVILDTANNVVHNNLGVA
jgi:hypothetical protein